MTKRSNAAAGAAAIIAMLLGTTATRSEAPAGLAPYAAKAREAVKAMGGKLQTELKAAIAAGGPVAAVQVCNTVAPQIADEQSKAAGLTIRRTALKVRNQSNAPDALERKVLEEFTAKIASGADPATLEHIEEVTEGGKAAVRYFKAIPTAKEPCLACHGSELTGELKDAISKLYPEDQATGFKAGDLRGAFSVTMEK